MVTREEDATAKLYHAMVIMGRMRNPTRIVARIVTICALIVAAHASAQSWPAKPIKLIVPNTPAGMNDITARLMAAKLPALLGQQVVVENKPGAGGTLGTSAAAHSPPDGYTLLAVFDAHATNPFLYKSTDYDTVADFAPISLMVRAAMVLVVHPKLDVKSVQELVQLAKAKPGAINFAIAGQGSPSRLLIEVLKRDARVDVTMVPYKGAGPALNDIVAGHSDAMFGTSPAVSAHVKAGRLIALAIASRERSALVPGVPTLNETWPGFISEPWVGLLAPAKTPPEIIARLHDDVVKVLAEPEVKTRLFDLGLEPVGSTSAQLDQWIRSELDKWGKVIREQKITIE